jgi:hypothetical protein
MTARPVSVSEPTVSSTSASTRVARSACPAHDGQDGSGQFLVVEVQRLDLTGRADGDPDRVVVVGGAAGEGGNPARQRGRPLGPSADPGRPVVEPVVRGVDVSHADPL